MLFENLTAHQIAHDHDTAAKTETLASHCEHTYLLRGFPFPFFVFFPFLVFHELLLQF